MYLTFRCKPIVEGYAEGEALVLNRPISFLGEVDPKTGVLRVDSVEEKIKDKILVFPHGKGSTVGSYVIYGLKRYNNKPKAIINLVADPVIVIGCVFAEIPLVICNSKELFRLAHSGDYIVVDTYRGIVILYKNV